MLSKLIFSALVCLALAQRNSFFDTRSVVGVRHFQLDGQPALLLQPNFQTRRLRDDSVDKVIIDYGKIIVDNCPPMLCTGLDCALVTERNGCQLCACPIGSPARGCDPMPFVLWHDLMTKGCPNGTDSTVRKNAQKVTRWFRRVNRFTNTDECESYVFPYCAKLDHNLWRSPRTKQECIDYCYSIEEQKSRFDITL